jgi:hypothetical protein
VARGEGAEGREERIARNESLFREVNERIKRISGNASPEPIEFLCECGDETCTATIPLSATEYERVRSDPTLFVVKPGHGATAVEHVIEQDDGYQIVSKHEDEARIARETDPRS